MVIKGPWVMSFLAVAEVVTAAGSSGTGSLLLLPTDVLTHASFHIKSWGIYGGTDRISQKRATFLLST